MKATDVLKSLTLDEKIGQLVQLYGRYVVKKNPETGEAINDSYNLSDEERSSVGSFLDNSVVDGARVEFEEFMSPKIGGRIPPLCMHDVIHGCDTIFPISLGLACSFEPNLMYDSSKIAAEESVKHNIHTVFAPMADLVRDARWGRVMESCGEDKLINSQMASAAVKGFHAGGVSCCVKHMAAYGGVESGREYNSVNIGKRVLREQVFPAYKAAVDAGVDMVMASYSAVDEVPPTADKELLNNILREEWGFDGIIISDSASIRELIPHGIAADKKEATRLAMNAGVDIDMSSDCYLRSLKQLFAEGTITEKQIDDACLRVLKLKEKHGLLSNSVSLSNDDYTIKNESLEKAKECAVKSAVLLKNNGVLPIAKNSKKIALIGPFSNTEQFLGNWICFGEKQYGKGIIKTVYESISKQFPDSNIASLDGCSWDLFDETSDFSDAEALAKSSDTVILCIGEHQMYSGEGNSRSDIQIPNAQLELAKHVISANKNTAVVLFCGRPLDISKLYEFAPAILCVWQPGTCGGEAIADLVSGVVSPSGKLTMSWPRSVGQCPIYYNGFNTGRPCWSNDVQKKRSMTSNYIDEYTSPLFPFGYGLSYSEFDYSNLEISSEVMKKSDELEICVDVKNIGKYDAYETVQLYIRDIYGSVIRPIKELKDYKKLFFKRNEMKTVKFKITNEYLKFWKYDMSFDSECGKFCVMVGTDSKHLLSKEFVLES